MKINFFSVLFYKIIFVLVTNLSFSQNSENYFKAGNDFYNNGQFEKALDSYFKVLNENYHSAELYYNIGNTYYKLDSIANSIFYFEKAKKISPMDRDILNNLGYAENMKIDLIEKLPKSQIENFQIYLFNLFSTNQWGYILLLLIWGFCILFSIYFLISNSRLKKIFFSITSLFFLLIIVTFIIGTQKSIYDSSLIEAIVFEKQISVNDEPNDRSEVLFNLHEGTKVNIIEKLENWLKIKLENGAEGWIKSKGIKQIH